MRQLHLQWHITERCNLNCLHCYQDTQKNELSENELLKILDKFIIQVEKWNIFNQCLISITGGEPLIRQKEIVSLLAKISQTKIQSSILTNGTLLTKDLIKNFEKLNLKSIQVSLDGLEENNDKIRGNGSFKEIIKSLNLLKKSKIKAIIGFTANKYNYLDLPEILDLAKSYNATLSFKRMVPLGGGQKIKKEMLSIDELKECWDYLLNQKLTNYKKITFGCESAILLQDYQHPELISDCISGYGIITLMPNGDIYPCRKLPIYAGNILKNSFSEIYNSKVFKNLRNIGNIAEVCQKCETFNVCQGGSRCMAFSYFENKNAPDPYCWKLFKNLPENKINFRYKDNNKLKDHWKMRKK